MKYATVSVMAEKAGGDLVHSIGSLVGMATSGGSPGRSRNGFARLRDTDGVRWNW